MIEPLVVEPSRLETAGNTLRDLPFPSPPAPIVAPGADSVSAAVNATLPIIESPVVDGLPAVKAALTRTGSSIAAAAGMYTDTDQRLGDRLTQVQFLAATKESSAGTSGDKPDGAPVDDEKPAPKPTPKPPTPQPDQMAGAGGMLGSVMQGMQGAMGSMQGMQGAGATPAQLADSNKPDDEARDKKSDDEVESEASAEGAAPGSETSVGIPTRPPAAARSEAAPAEINL
ncbi:hypothetical protein [Mycobacterium sp. E3339]|uniref:hypothetical protein n=1 Tax=Mycobacterium sp. E3339 TaxID=1834146 RepID=UPI0007FD8770|nr:hypothetical protein [Mycobacterium sp. E3339]OBG61121.1 hypothetical protein A5702_03295 [Mycobacterium sp. E3339]